MTSMRPVLLEYLVVMLDYKWKKSQTTDLVDIDTNKRPRHHFPCR